MSQMPPILVAGLFRELHGHLVALLRSLSPEDWHRPTSSSERNVKDIASHLLDGSVRRLSIQRDGYTPPDAPSEFCSPQELVAYLHRVNGEWTRATRRVSPKLLLQWLDSTGEELADFFEGLDPFAPALYPVAWAGEESSLNWFDLAREYTEKWHHTQQIFEAVARPSTITARRLFHPCLDTFLRALPFTYRQVQAEEGTSVTVTIHGEAGGDWFLLRRARCWVQVAEGKHPPAARVALGQDSAWKLFTKRTDRQTALARFEDITFDGDRELGLHVLDMVSVMA
jgi:Mycothiol maleylpyruvate isomerase N-terminal domain